MQRVDLADFLLIAESHMGIDAGVLARMPRVSVLAASALAVPFSGFGDHEVFPGFHTKAAVYCSRIVRYHPLPDANKRTAYDVMREFIDRNDATFTHPAGGWAETAEVVESLAAGTLSETAFIAWLRPRIA